MRILAFILMVLGVVTSQAQELAEDTTAQAPEAETRPVPTMSTAPAQEFETPDVFDPTEKLSEDLSAKFPVDI
tara:strand:+ start:339 stop:557 length:219 start_codon:yes stop_codon:yes gene_type:complete